jgi:hypothetical protein
MSMNKNNTRRWLAAFQQIEGRSSLQQVMKNSRNKIVNEYLMYMYCTVRMQNSFDMLVTTQTKLINNRSRK